MATERPKTPEPVGFKGFTYGLDGFKAYNENRESLAEFKALLFPKQLKTVEKRRDAERRRKEKVKAPWLRAQLKHYGIEYQSSDSVTTLEQLLKEGISSCKRKTVPTSIVAIENRLSGQFEYLLKAHHDKVNALQMVEADCQDARDSEFDALGSPELEAQYDMDRFMLKYFADATTNSSNKWRPAPHKTTKPMVLCKLKEETYRAIHSAVARVDGLLACNCGRASIVVGWNASQVARLAVERNALLPPLKIEKNTAGDAEHEVKREAPEAPEATRSLISAAAEHPRHPLPPRSKGFTYHWDGLKAYQHKRESLEDLREQLFPPELKPGPRKYNTERRLKEKAKEEKARATWVKSQLRHYAIDFKPSDDASTLERVLKEAVTAGRCNTVPDSVRAIEEDLSRKHESQLKTYEEQCNAWRKIEEDRKDREFAALGSPRAEANYCLYRFIAKYFADPDPSRRALWRAAPQKTPEPMASTLFDHIHSLELMSEDVHGLQRCWGGSGQSKTLILGWDRSKVQRLAGELDAKFGKELSAWEIAEIEMSMDRHTEYLKSRRSPKGAQDISGLTGSWIIRCKYIQENWNSNSYPMKLTMDIIQQDSPFGVQAAFNFEIIEGIMLLSPTQSVLADFMNSLEHDPDASETDDSDSPWRSRSDSNKKRKYVQQGHILDDKKQKLDTTANSSRFNLRWRGRETGNGEIQMDTAPSYNNGHIDVDFRQATFKGVIKADIFDTVPFKGYKVSDAPKSTPPKWWDLSEKQWNYECTARWH
ncbi:hypothetical protein NA57DRAFT_53271 [Rhizodiscina lignyota]|uniref:Uncharacterized protein n=1 Tax=Rhizodiscina lignyota TaxID=1504668 RepID=A0A9P4IL84_9PEZI|nr:hypothetical protein NA57DRAFT_53271 [Rhizodiscina lignyota]